MGTLVEVYLQSRGLYQVPSAALRFSPATWHGPTARRLPAMVALVEGADGVAVHRTFLRSDGTAKAEVDCPKLMLGRVKGGAVRLRTGGEALLVAEGIESALSASQLLDRPASVWAALSAGGVANLRLPSRPGQLILAVDSDDKTGIGAEKSHNLGTRARAAGWDVRWWPAPIGQDWNDVLRAGLAVRP